MKKKAIITIIIVVIVLIALGVGGYLYFKPSAGIDFSAGSDALGAIGGAASGNPFENAKLNPFENNTG